MLGNWTKFFLMPETAHFICENYYILSYTLELFIGLKMAY